MLRSSRSRSREKAVVKEKEKEKEKLPITRFNIHPVVKEKKKEKEKEKELEQMDVQKRLEDLLEERADNLGAPRMVESSGMRFVQVEDMPVSRWRRAAAPSAAEKVGPKVQDDMSDGEKQELWDFEDFCDSQPYGLWTWYDSLSEEKKKQMEEAYGPSWAELEEDYLALKDELEKDEDKKKALDLALELALE